MARPKKESTFIDAGEAERLVSKLERGQECKISVSDFMRLNIRRFKNTGLSRKTIYDNLTRGGLNLGSFGSFSGHWDRAEKSGMISDISSNPEEAEPVKQSKKKGSMTSAEEKKDGKTQKRRKTT